jgi:hypothetical protein
MIDCCHITFNDLSNLIIKQLLFSLMTQIYLNKYLTTNPLSMKEFSNAFYHFVH